MTGLSESPECTSVHTYVCTYLSKYTSLQTTIHIFEHDVCYSRQHSINFQIKNKTKKNPTKHF